MWAACFTCHLYSRKHGDTDKNMLCYIGLSDLILSFYGTSLIFSVTVTVKSALKRSKLLNFYQISPKDYTVFSHCTGSVP